MRARFLVPAGCLIALALGCGGAAISEASRETPDAHEQWVKKTRALLETGDEPAARVRIGLHLDEEPACAHALVELTFVELSRADLVAAAAAVRRLAAAAPEAPEPAVLRALVEQRAANPAAKWIESYRAAWNSAGRPDLSESELIGPSFSLEMPDQADLAEVFKRAGRPDKALVALAAFQELPEGAQAIEERLVAEEDVGLMMVMIERLRTSPPEARARKVRDAAVARLIEGHPEVAYFRLLELQGYLSSETPLSSEEARELIETAALPAFAPDLFPTTYQRLHETYVRLGGEGLAVFAFAGALGTIPTDPIYTLCERLLVSEDLSPDLRTGAARALWSHGEALLGGRTVLEKLVAVMVLKKMAALLNDPRRIEGAQVAADRWRSIHTRYRQTNAGNIRVRPMQDELRRAFVSDEAETMRQLGGPL